MQPGRILIADHRQLIREALAQALRREPDMNDFVEASRFEEATECLRDPRITLAIFGLGLPGLSSVRDLGKVRQQRPDVRVVVVTSSGCRQNVLAALDAGVHGYIVKTLQTEAMIERIRYVMSGEIYVPPSLADVAGQATGEGTGDGTTGDRATADIADRTVATHLTERQIDVLRLIVEGRSNKEISRAVAIADGTVKMHVAAVLKALGATNRAQAAAIGISHLKSVEPDPSGNSEQG